MSYYALVSPAVMLELAAGGTVIYAREDYAYRDLQYLLQYDDESWDFFNFMDIE